MEKMSIAECRDKLLMNSVTCHSKYKKRGDKCRYCEVDFSVGMICRAKEMLWRSRLEDKYLTYPEYFDIFTVASMCNQEKYFAYFGEDAVRAEWAKDKTLMSVTKILERLKSKKNNPQSIID